MVGERWRVACPVTTCLAVLGVPVAAAGLMFNEPVSSVQWLGMLLRIVGFVLASVRQIACSLRRSSSTPMILAAR
jgi:drug/metabolite transporter (DMT)-like permease